MKKYWKENAKNEDKYLLLACASHKFEKIEKEEK